MSFQIPAPDFKRPNKKVAEAGIQAICGFAGCEVAEPNVQPDHVHLVEMVPPKVSISQLLGRLKGQTSSGYSSSFEICRKSRESKATV